MSSPSTERETSTSPQGGLPLELDPVEEAIERLATRSHRLSRWRLALFLVFAGGLLAGFESRVAAAAIALPALAAFFVAFLRHGRVLAEKRELERRRLLLLEEDERRQNRRRPRAAPELRPDATALEQGLRLYAPEAEAHELDSRALDDLDLIAGPRNLFSFLDVSSSEFGARRLRYMISHVLFCRDEIGRRQRAVAELAGARATRRRILEALLFLRGKPLRHIPQFLHSPAEFAGRRLLWLSAHVLGTTVPACLIAAVVWPPAIGLAFLAAILNLAIIGANLRASNPARDRLLAFGPFLDGIVRLERSLAVASCNAAALCEAHATLATAAPAAVRLRRYVTWLGLHDYGVLFEVLNVILLWELRILPSAERVFLAHRELLERAAGALGEVEALASLACPLDEQEGYTLPEVLESTAPLLEARGMAHPLIDGRRAVRNDIVLGGTPEDGEAERTRVLILTGSNMSGKSTYLKATGVNAVLAGMGGPVCARRFRWTPLAVFTDVNVRDSLDDGKSYFQVEVERVLAAIRAARESPFVLVLFDELFRGTNADERLALSRAILRYLRDTGALGVVATHDNALPRLVTADGEPGMANVHLREEVHGHAMTFDYRVRSGPATTRNATRVLEVSGYPSDVIRRARAELGEPEEPVAPP